MFKVITLLATMFLGTLGFAIQAQAINVQFPDTWDYETEEINRP